MSDANEVQSWNGWTHVDSPHNRWMCGNNVTYTLKKGENEVTYRASGYHTNLDIVYVNGKPPAEHKGWKYVAGTSRDTVFNQFTEWIEKNVVGGQEKA